MVSKLQERIFAEAASGLLSANWQILDIPEPVDFEVRTPSEIFGLEVRQIFVDGETHFGSMAKKNESDRVQIVRDIAKNYYKSGGIPIYAQFLGPIVRPNVKDLVQAMVVSAPTYPGSNKTIKIHQIKIFMTPIPSSWSNYSHWTYLNDRGGWLREVQSSNLQKAIDKKKDKLALYNQKYRDIDLLLVADRIFNSGKLAGVDHIQISNPGFRAIYFMSYPESIHRLA